MVSPTSRRDRTAHFWYSDIGGNYSVSGRAKVYFLSKLSRSAA